MPNEPRACLVIDVANVMGSRPDGWWRDRAAAATRWLADLDRLVGRSVTMPGGRTMRVTEMVAVVEGKARQATPPEGASLRVVRAAGDGDSAIVDVTEQTLALAGTTAPEGAEGTDAVLPTAVLVVTADRGLRERLPAGVRVAGPGWLRQMLE
jgi:hypothetical protein